MTKAIVENIDALQDTYCRDCPVKQALREDKGKRGAHHFCISACSIGKKLQQLGTQLTRS
ncbi:hypothetical protein CH76_07895 [Lysinibacillus sp. BF-4]|uniref:zinc-finger domain-containing protein n=1 Tax=Lysinibacillus sp. BF-4 TaxID=1473546 RepID=UPI000508C279|nr:zinc-finger domain-containing protein [Lysinibacillus sp. BF-4]KFL43220.1 hypothetical protein CH76_07895 [Lysinibacillus sp. BF-4]